MGLEAPAKTFPLSRHSEQVPGAPGVGFARTSSRVADLLGRLCWRRTSPPWNDRAPVREELFGVERLEQHGESLAAAQPVTACPPIVRPLRRRLADNAAALLTAYRASASELERGRRVVPAAEWLLDNYHVVEEQIREIRDDLPPGYYRQLPKLASGPFAGYPRVFGLAWAFVAHTDSHLDLELLRRFIAAYQRVQPLSIGELWAVAITLRIVLVENLRRLVDQIGQGRAERAEADALADALLTPGCAASALATDIARRSPAALSEIFAAQLARRLRDQDPKTNPALNWLDERLQQQGSSVEQAVQHAQQRQGASNVSVRNVITSMRLISAIDWAKLFESVSLVDARLDADGSFGRMDFPTRNLYRSAIEQLARSAPLSELAIAEQALAKARSTAAPGILGEHWSEPGYHLIGGGRRAFEAHIGFRSPPSLWLGRLGGRLGILGYVGATLLLSGLLLGVTVYVLQVPGLGDGGWQWLALVGALFVPFSEAAVALVNRAVTGGVGAAILPGLELADGIPEELRTLVVVPTLLGGEAELLEQIEQLEVHYLTGTRGDLSFALLADGIDARQSVLERDVRLLKLGAAAIERLNRRHAPAPGGPRFLLLYRQRRFNPQERRWIGWERKRGKLHELNRLLRGATDTSFASLGESGPTVPSGVRFVITLDADTRLPRETLRRLIGKMAHPLNQPLFEAATQRVVSGYAILQPRVTPALPLGREGSLYQRVFSGPGGMDPYAAAVSDVYQDLFGEGSYTGKGIYDVDAFETAMAGRIGENSVLSHDLFEGIFARAGLASDVEVVEEAPARFDVVAQRLHRWTRGDWQLLPWIIGHWRGEWAVPWVGRSKMLDNLRRSLLAPSAALALLFSWLLPMPQALFGSLLLVGSLALPACLPVCLGLWPRRRGIGLRHHFSAWAAELRRALLQTLLSLAFLADQAWRMGDAIVRTLLRMFVTRRHLLEWTTSAQSVGKPRPGLAISYLQMVGGTSLTLGAAALVLYLQPSSLALGVPFMLLWALAPALAVYSSRVPRPSKRKVLAPEEAMGLRLIARQTWRFFETFVGAEDNRLPPDNFQDQPRPVVAHRTSPTNIGLYLLSAVAARDFGWAGTQETLERLEATLAAMQRLSRHRGHFFNWYATLDLHVLEPAYVSSVDSGNLAGHLIALANACEEWLDEPLSPAWRNGLGDTLALVRQGLDGLPRGAGHWRRLRTTVEEIQAQIDGPQSAETGLAGLRRLAEKAVRDAVASAPRGVDAVSDELLFWLDALRNSVVEHQRDRLLSAAPLLEARVRSVAKQARAFVAGMDFAFLFNTERDLFSIGYSLADNSLDSSCYDLLASEARLASLIAIAKGDVPTRHWFRLGRTATPVGTASALISWSGSMFEYLMPSLVMRAPVGSLLEQSNHLVVEVQQAYGRKKGVPWGISESAFNARDLEFTYQYSNFGVPGLGLKRGLAENLVVAPYATGLAAMIKPRAALFNYARLAELGARGRYGFYEALDFTPSRLPDATAVALVHSYMAHHQGMSIVAIANALDEGRMRTRFHREPMIRAVELLLQERIPSDVFLAHPRAEEVRVSSYEAGIEASTLRRVALTPGESPVTHLLSNGRYSVMLSASGAGYSRWRDIAVTRWREDPTRDDWGYYVLLRDVHDGRTWAATTQPSGQVAVSGEILFDEDRAEFSRHDGSLSSVLEVLVSGEDDGEVRRITLVNNGRRSQEIELTSYAELVLAPAAADDAHPAFSKLFVQTEYVAEYAALVATRRLRSGTETPVWAAHFAVVEGALTAPVEYESDRARFLGRGRTLRDVLADLRRPLSGSAGTVLDPVFSLRRRLRIAPGEMARVSFWIVVAETREALFDLIDKHHERSGFDRARTLAWTQAQVQLRDLDIAAGEAADFQRLAAPLLYADARYRAPPESIRHGSGPQSGLWPLGISGDLPILLLRLDDSDDLEQLRQILRAHQYWRTKGLEVDLAVVNERASSYIQDLQVAIETAVRSSPSRTREGEDAARRGQVHTLRADLMSQEGRALLLAVARVVLLARRGPIASQLAALCSSRPIPTPAATAGTARLVASDEGGADKTSLGEALEFFNGLGGFGSRGQEYVILLEKGESTPAPWINVIANPRFGFQVSAEGSGYTWAENSRENQLTPWSNDPVGDPCVEAFYLRDEDSRALWSVTARPIRDDGLYSARHGFGYSRFGHRCQGIDMDLVQFVALADPIKISRLVLRNLSGKSRRLSFTSYAEPVLGSARATSAAFIETCQDVESGALLARNPWNAAFPGRVLFADLCGRQSSWSGDRREFLGPLGDPSAPAALLGEAGLSGCTGAGLDPCMAQQCSIELAPGEVVEIVALFGQADSLAHARDLVTRYRRTDPEETLAGVGRHWRTLLGAVQVSSPERSLDILLNGWLLYQTLACRVWARSAFYQASGAYGFRDQLQDGMALSLAAPALTREHLLRAAGRQFREGDVQHWWLPHSGQGVRTRISDDRVWLAYAASLYLEATADIGILDEVLPFIEGPPLQEGEQDTFFQPMPSEQSASLFEHCARGLDQCLTLTGKLGLPLIGSGDWNDGMNRVGAGGTGESVWLGWLLLETLARFDGYARSRDPERARHWREHAGRLRLAMEREAWDGHWYRRATFDDGTWLGSKNGEACRIDSIAQSWAVLAGADPLRAGMAMTALERYLLRPVDRLALLFSPPFDERGTDPGYIRGYPPGLRENGGQYSHAAMWAVLAFVRQGKGDKAGTLLSLLNPINHALTPEQVERYRVEPYVVAADIYSEAPHVGRGGWTWYTGSAAWMYRAGLEGLLGIRRQGAWLLIDPCIPVTWSGFEVSLEVEGGHYEIQVESGEGRSHGVREAFLDGVEVECIDGQVRVPLDCQRHRLRLSL